MPDGSFLETARTIVAPFTPRAPATPISERRQRLGRQVAERELEYCTAAHRITGSPRVEFVEDCEHLTSTAAVVTILVRKFGERVRNSQLERRVSQFEPNPPDYADITARIVEVLSDALTPAAAHVLSAAVKRELCP